MLYGQCNGDWKQSNDSPVFVSGTLKTLRSRQKLNGLHVYLVVQLLYFGCKDGLHYLWGPELPARRTDDGNWELHVMHRSSVGWMETTLKCASTKSK